jgi:hypothetical protein
LLDSMLRSELKPNLLPVRHNVLLNHHACAQYMQSVSTDVICKGLLSAGIHLESSNVRMIRHNKTYMEIVQGDQKASVHLMITI